MTLSKTHVNPSHSQGSSCRPRAPTTTGGRPAAGGETGDSDDKRPRRFIQVKRSEPFRQRQITAVISCMLEDVPHPIELILTKLWRLVCVGMYFNFSLYCVQV